MHQPNSSNALKDVLDVVPVSPKTILLSKYTAHQAGYHLIHQSLEGCGCISLTGTHNGGLEFVIFSFSDSACYHQVSSIMLNHH